MKTHTIWTTTPVSTFPCKSPANPQQTVTTEPNRMVASSQIIALRAPRIVLLQVLQVMMGLQRVALRSYHPRPPVAGQCLAQARLALVRLQPWPRWLLLPLSAASQRHH